MEEPHATVKTVRIVRSGGPGGVMHSQINLHMNDGGGGGGTVGLAAERGG